ncbi:MAG: helix-turn-helix domain-containing protein [Phycisphaerae bacterium]|nr:helix-turn-helix domain-containing protein [Phycisphaerae bacterium]
MRAEAPAPPRPPATPAGGPVTLALNAPDAAAALGISTRLLWSMTNQNRIPHVRIGRRVIYPTAELQKWLNEQISKGGRR